MLPLVIQLAQKPQESADFGAGLSTRDLALWLGISHTRIAQLGRAGVLPRNAQSRYPLQPAVRAYCEYLATASKGAPTDEKTRLTIAQRHKIELEIAQKQGELLPAADVESTWTVTLTAVRQAMLAVPSRVGERLPHLTAHDVATVDRAVRDALAEAAGDDAA